MCVGIAFFGLFGMLHLFVPGESFVVRLVTG